jgi:chemotaxis protein MotB
MRLAYPKRHLPLLISNDGAELMEVLAQEPGKVPNRVAIEDHTDSKPYAEGAAYGNWELSADRANATRRLMQTKGIRQDR